MWGQRGKFQGVGDKIAQVPGDQDCGFGGPRLRP